MAVSTDPVRLAVQAARMARLKGAAAERARLVGLLVAGGQTDADAADAVDRMIIALRDADAVRLEQAYMTHGGDRGVKYASEGADWLRAHRYEAPVAVAARAPRRGLRFLLVLAPGAMREPALCRITRAAGDVVHWREGVAADGTGGTPRRTPAVEFPALVLRWVE